MRGWPRKQAPLQVQQRWFGLDPNRDRSQLDIRDFKPQHLTSGVSDPIGTLLCPLNSAKAATLAALDDGRLEVTIPAGGNDNLGGAAWNIEGDFDVAVELAPQLDNSKTLNTSMSGAWGFGAKIGVDAGWNGLAYIASAEGANAAGLVAASGTDLSSIAGTGSDLHVYHGGNTLMRIIRIGTSLRGYFSTDWGLSWHGTLVSATTVDGGASSQLFVFGSNNDAAKTLKVMCGRIKNLNENGFL